MGVRAISATKTKIVVHRRTPHIPSTPFSNSCYTILSVRNLVNIPPSFELRQCSLFIAPTFAPRQCSGGQALLTAYCPLPETPAHRYSVWRFFPRHSFQTWQQAYTVRLRRSGRRTCRNANVVAQRLRTYR
jgi:hypothetical protein